MVKAISNGYVQKEIQNSAWEYQRKIESNEIDIVGLNRFSDSRKRPVALLKIDPQTERNQIRRLEKFRKNRDNNATVKAIENLKNASMTSENLVPYIIEAAENMATIGEIANALRDVFGEYHESVSL
jgi:methylmalonyl-CoA mutase N-terminal domain/subunit